MSNDSIVGLVFCIGLGLFSLYAIFFGVRRGILQKKIPDSPIGNILSGSEAVKRGIFWVSFGIFFLIIAVLGVLKALNG